MTSWDAIFLSVMVYSKSEKSKHRLELSWSRSVHPQSTKAGGVERAAREGLALSGTTQDSHFIAFRTVSF